LKENLGCIARSNTGSAVSTRAERAPHWGEFELFVDEHVVAGYLGLTPRRVVEMARKNQLPAHPIGDKRKTWRFRLSEIEAHFSARARRQDPATIDPAVPITQERKCVA
jgi:hypothetical protein